MKFGIGIFTDYQFQMYPPALVRGAVAAVAAAVAAAVVAVDEDFRYCACTEISQSVEKAAIANINRKGCYLMRYEKLNCKLLVIAT